MKLLNYSTRETTEIWLFSSRFAGSNFLRDEHTYVENLRRSIDSRQSRNLVVYRGIVFAKFAEQLGNYYEDLGKERGWFYPDDVELCRFLQRLVRNFLPAPEWFSRACISRNLSRNRVFNLVETKVQRLCTETVVYRGSLVAGRLVRWISSSSLEFLAYVTATTTYLEDISRGR